MKNLYGELNGIRVLTEQLNLLEFIFDLCNKNCTKIYPDVEKLFEFCKRRNKLTLVGKCTAINSLALTKLLYIANIVENPDEKDTYINCLIYNLYLE